MVKALLHWTQDKRKKKMRSAIYFAMKRKSDDTPFDTSQAYKEKQPGVKERRKRGRRKEDNIQREE